MPSKIQLDENLWFLYICLQNSDLKAIDFNAVGHHTNLKPPAARMRYTRLRRQIENGTLIGTHGTPFSSPSEKIAEAIRRRKRGNREPNSNLNSNPDSNYKTSTSNPSQNSAGKGESEDGNDGLKERKRRSKVLGGSREEVNIKQETDNAGRENGEGEEDAEFEEVSVSSSDEFTDADSEDEIPLAKRMRTKCQSQFPGTYQNNNNYQSPYQLSSNQYPQLPQQHQKQQYMGNHSGLASGSGPGNSCAGIGVDTVGGAGTSFSRQQDTPRYPNPFVVNNPQRQSQNQKQGSYNFGNHLFGNQEQYQHSQMTSRFREDDAHARNQKVGWSFGQGNYHGMGNGQ